MALVNSDIQIYLVYFIFLGILNQLIVYKISKAIFSACTIYWIAWVFLYICAIYSQERDLIPKVGLLSLELSLQASLGAFVGFIVGSILANKVFVKKETNINQYFRNNQFDEDAVILEILLNKYFLFLLSVFFCLGSLHLLDVLGRLRYDNYPILLNIRLTYLHDFLTPIGRISSIIHVFTTPIALLLGYVDFYFKVRPWRICLLILVSSLHGLAMGGRGFLLGLIIPYSLSFLICLLESIPINQNTTNGKNKMYIMNETLSSFLKFLLFYIPIALLLFSWLAQLRHYDVSKVSNLSFSDVTNNAIDQFAGWFGMSLSALGPVSEYLSKNAQELGYGRTVFSFFSTYLERFGLISGNWREETLSFVPGIRENLGSLGFTPPTAIPTLVLDFGLSFMPVYMAIIMTICQFATAKFRYGIFWHVSYIVALLMSLMTIQSNLFFNAPNTMAIIFSFFLQKYLMSQKNRLVNR